MSPPSSNREAAPSDAAAAPDADLAKLNAFLVDNEDLENLNARLSTFNLFHVLRIERAEIRHSNVLAWLLTPTESHGLGDALLRRFVSRLLLDHTFDGVTLTPADVELMELEDVEVLREWMSIDVAVRLRGRSRPWAVLIENKVGASEHTNQLERYWKDLTAELPDTTILPVLLTLDGDEPSDRGRALGYVPMSYGEVLEIVERVYERNRLRVPEGARVLIEHYIETLKRLTMQDEELVRLCRNIYRKHREAIDMVVEYGVTSHVLDACREEISALIDPRIVAQTKNYLFFLPKEFPDWQVAELRGWKFLGANHPVIWWFQQIKGKLQLAFEVGPIADVELREELLRRLKSAGLKVPDWAFSAGTKKMYTRVVSVTRPLPIEEGADDTSSDAAIREVARTLWQQGWEKGSAAIPVLREFAAREVGRDTPHA